LVFLDQDLRIFLGLDLGAFLGLDLLLGFFGFSGSVLLADTKM
jgi:hypothetical protein